MNEKPKFMTHERIMAGEEYVSYSDYLMLQRERDEARQEWGKASMDAAQLLSEKTTVIAERDEARESAAKWEAVALREASINGARICAKEDAK